MSAPERTFDFGADVIVSAETVRVVGQVTDDKPVFRQAASRRDAGRYVQHDFAGALHWPGAAIGADWEPDRLFNPHQEVEGDTVLVRLRRMLYRVPEVGIVVGATRRQEGRILAGGRPDQVDRVPATLAGPGRTVNLVEIALQPKGSTKARLILAHRYDLQLIVDVGRRNGGR